MTSDDLGRKGNERISNDDCFGAAVSSLFLTERDEGRAVGGHGCIERSLRLLVEGAAHLVQQHLLAHQ